MFSKPAWEVNMDILSVAVKSKRVKGDFKALGTDLDLQVSHFHEFQNVGEGL